MNLKWAATFIIVVVGVLAVWRGAASTPQRGGTTLDAATIAPLDARGAVLAKEIARLRDRLQPGETLRHGRNLFRFVTAAPRPVQISRAVSVEAPPVPPPILKLIGVAEDTASGGLIRTAIISGPGQVYVVKEGERVTSRYVVARVSADVVELEDLDPASDQTSLRRLALK